MEIIFKARELAERGQDFVLATVVGVRGSAPRDSGARMIICRDGSTFGTIGGGALEHYVCEHSADVFKNGSKLFMAVSLDGNKGQVDMTCGGIVELFIQYIDSSRAVYGEVYQAILDVRGQVRPAWLVTGVELGNDTLCLITNNGDFIGNIDSIEITELLWSINTINTTSILKDLQLMVEPIAEQGTAYIFGAGHIAGSLVPLLNTLGFKTVVIDDRHEYANTNRFAASQIIVADMDEVFEQLVLDKESYIVIITRGHTHDRVVLGQALQRPAAYIGMIGSKRKRETIYNALLEQGFSREDLNRVYSPIGLPIQAESPEEIAVSIAAELIQVRAGFRSTLKSSSCPEPA